MRDQLNPLRILTIVLMFAQPANSFSSFENDGGNVHEQITRDALAGTISDTNLGLIVKAGNSQDVPGEEGAREPRRHFDDGNFSGALGYVDREKKKALNYAGEADTDAENLAHCLRHFGLMLHTVQDFYSRSNYLELQLEDPAKRSSPYNIDVVDWAKVPDGYVGRKSDGQLTSGRRPGEKSKSERDAAPSVSYAELNKDNPQAEEGKKTVSGVTYFKIARDLAVRETLRQWNLFEALIRSRYQQRADAIIAALKKASPASNADSD